MRTSIKALVAASLVGLGLTATPAFADETDPPKEFTVSGYVQGVTDYRFRGLSLTAGDPAIQGTININHKSGFYVGAWSSSLEDTPVYGSQEVDLYGGWTGPVTSGLTLDAGLLYYVYPNGHVGHANYFEPYASLTAAIGPATAKVGVAYAPKQRSLDFNGDGKKDDNTYVYGELGTSIPNTGIGLSAHLGYADGAQSPKFLTGASATYKGGFDYSLGATYNITSNLSVGVSYVGVDGNSIKNFSDDAVVGTIKLAL